MDESAFEAADRMDSSGTRQVSALELYQEALRKWGFQSDDS